MKTLPRVASEMALHVLAYNLTRVMNIMGIRKPEKRLLNATRPKLLRFDTSGKAFLHNQDPFQTPKDIGEMAAFLASDRAENITGAAFNVDGG